MKFLNYFFNYKLNSIKKKDPSNLKIKEIFIFIQFIFIDFRK
jgi:hypothetical protein